MSTVNLEQVSREGGMSFSAHLDLREETSVGENN